MFERRRDNLELAATLLAEARERGSRDAPMWLMATYEELGDHRRAEALQ